MNVQVSTRVSTEIKDEAEKVYAEYGLDIPTVMRMVITMTAKRHEMPLKIGGDTDRKDALWDKAVTINPNHDPNNAGKFKYPTSLPKEEIEAWSL